MTSWPHHLKKTTVCSWNIAIYITHDYMVRQMKNLAFILLLLFYCFLRQTQLNLTNLEYLSETWNNLTQSNQGSETKFRKLINHSQQLHCTIAPCSYHEQTQRGTNWEAQSRRYLLMLLPSLSLSPSAPLLLALSLPAKSTRLSLLTFSPMDCKTSKLC